MATAADTGTGRAAVYATLRRRNRVIGLLRILIPLAGAGVLAVLGVQLVIANLAHDFTIGNITISSSRVTVDAPTYAGRLSDGGIFTITGSKATAAIGRFR